MAVVLVGLFPRPHSGSGAPTVMVVPGSLSGSQKVDWDQDEDERLLHIRNEIHFG
jgi:hypothetical protein